MPSPTSPPSDGNRGASVQSDRGPVSLLARVRVFLRDVERVVTIDHLAMLFGADPDAVARACADLVAKGEATAAPHPDTRRRGYHAVKRRRRTPRPIDPEIPHQKLIAELCEADERFAARMGSRRFTPAT